VIVAHLGAGQELCVPGLEVPQRAAAVVLGGVPEPLAPSAVSRAGELCVSGPLTLTGTDGAADTGPPPTVDGAPLDARVSVRYPEAAEHSLLARLGTAMDRATRFKPVGPWAGWLALLVAAGGCVVAVATVARPRRVALAVALVALTQAASFALLTPAFDGPDEPDHFAYTESLARGSGLPDEDPASVRPAYSDRHGWLLIALRHRARTATPQGEAIYTDRDERSPAATGAGLDAGNGGGHTVPTRIHSPAYYALTVPGYAAGSALAGETGGLLGARLVSALGLLVIALCAFAIVRELAPRRPELAAAAGMLVALQPELGFVAGVVNNDSGVNAASAVVIWLAVRALRRPLEVRAHALLGGALALAVLMKATALSLSAVLAVVLLAGLVRHGGGALRPALAALGAWLLPLAAWVLVAPRVGRDAAAGELSGQIATALGAVLALQLLAPVLRRGPRATLAALAGVAALGVGVVAVHERAGTAFSYIWQIFLPRPGFMTDHWAQGWPNTFVDVYLRETFGGYGQLAFIVPDSRGHLVLAGAVALAALGVWSWRKRRGHGWAPALLLVAPVAVVIAVELAYVTADVRAVPAEQGRYLFPAAAAVAALAALAPIGLGARWSRAVAAVAVVGMAGLALDGRLFYLAEAYL
jgi:hypothetical protein